MSEADEHDLVYVGVVGIIDPPREEVPDAVAEARRAGVRVVMVTGDYPTTACAIAQDLGIIVPAEKAVTGAELDALSPGQLRDVTGKTSVFARVAPGTSSQIVKALQAQREVVAVTGDGVNDAPALKAADIGVAMGTGTEVTKEAANMILGDDNFATIVAAVRQGRVIFDNIRKFLRYLLSSNMGEVFTVFFGVVFASFVGIAGAGGEEIVVPLLATQILWINLVTDAAPALAMGVDPEIEDVMGRPPRRVERPHHRSSDVDGNLVYRLGDGRRHPVDDGHLSAGGARGRIGFDRGRTHRWVHYPGARPTLQRVQLPFGDQRRMGALVHQRVAVGGGGFGRDASDRGRARPIPAGGLRDRVAGRGALGGGDRHGVGCAVV